MSPRQTRWTSGSKRRAALFFIDGGSVLYLIGSTMDWQEDDFTAGFVFQNPNAKGSCGCGESFTV
jgi:iron-sulfur cluster assembly protein